MCTVLLRFDPGSLTLAAVRDEFADRPWDPPAAHWESSPGIIGGRDRQAGGTWLAVSPGTRSVAALLNGVRLPPLATGARPTRGTLVLSALEGTLGDDFAGYDGFHLVLGSPDSVTVWSWDGNFLTRQELAPGNHIVVNAGVDTVDDPLVPHFAPLLADLSGDLGDWRKLLLGDGLAPNDERALLVRHEHEGRIYASGSAALITVDEAGMRFDFTATPTTPTWYPVAL